jgi:hypothetical protein
VKAFRWFLELAFDRIIERFEYACRRDPGARWDIEQVLGSTFFSGLPSLPYRCHPS